MNPNARDYAAFVSYRHQPEDKRWAEWLVEALETFETPDELVRAGTRRRIGKVFRDDNELGASADLTDAIKKALYASEYLIVVCSPATPSSQWVRTEIRYFQH
jgi:hypothetical protein